ncbi:elongation factor EF-2 [Candidatus Woesearchaeota archaeon]|nr:elongation factor EF-2 [Candidatus Woesearchaeota archaeon]USN44789.1 MAG: elongation factor EF-2 [Candidatus Woesearchaeota archaeon]
MAKDLGQAVVDAMKRPTLIRNIAIAAHIDHGKTTLSDNLLSGAGMISEELAGKQRFMDFHEDEAARGITIDAANVSMVHNVEGTDFLINLIDTPGHVDFGGDVTRAMRAVDGAVVLSCAVEGIMPQTETVLRQALKEKVKPILFINKADRLIKELKLTPEMMQERFVKIINSLNLLIEKIAPPEFKQKWKVNVNDGSVIFGSAFSNWALSVPYMQKKGINFKKVIDAYEAEDPEEIKKLAKEAPLHTVLLNSVVDHLPNPVVAQKYRIPLIWPGDNESKVGKDLSSCDPAGELGFVVTKITQDKHAGEVCTGRMFSGTVRKGMEVVTSKGKKGRIQQVFVSKGPQRVQIEEAVAGNIVGIAGIKDIFVGETVSVQGITPFEDIQHIFEPVVTVAVEPTKPADLPKLVEVLKIVAKEDPSLKVTINEETGEFLIAGMGELHLEVVTNRIKEEKGFPIKVSPPIVVYRESVSKLSAEVEGKSPNKHNKFYMTVEPLEASVAEAIANGDIHEGRVKKKDRAYWDLLTDKGLDKDESERVKDIYQGNMFIDMTRGIVALNEVIELVLDSFEEVMRGGPLAREGCVKLKVKLNDVSLHEDSIHRGPGQVYPAVRDGLKEAITGASAVLFEPVQILQVDCPQDQMGNVSSVIQNRRGQVLDMVIDEDNMTIIAKIPVAETFGLSGDLRSATGGRGSFFVKAQTFEQLPRELQDNIIRNIRTRKGLTDNQ